MNIDEAVILTQDRLASEGETMGDLLGHFRDRVSPVLVGDPEWERILECASKLPITMGALPFGFELPLHARRPEADFGVSLASGTRTAASFRERARTDKTDETARAITRLFRQMDTERSPLRDIVGRKLMLEYDIGSAGDGECSMPGMFLRPGERPIIGARGQVHDVRIAVDALLSCVGWKMKQAERENVEQVYLAQPEDTRMDSFGVFPSRARTIRLAIMGFKSQTELRSYLEDTGWPGRISAVDSVIARFKERADVVRTGANIDVSEAGVGPTLGLTLIVKQRYTKDSRYWLDGLTDWDPFLDAIGHEDLVVPEKLTALAGWVSKPAVLFGKSGRYVLLRGIHHIKLVISGDRLRQAKAMCSWCFPGRSLLDVGHERTGMASPVPGSGTGRLEPCRIADPDRSAFRPAARRPSGLPAAAKAGGDGFELLLGDVRIGRQGEMHRLHVALVNLDVHRLGNCDAQFLADGRLRIRQKLLPEIRVEGGFLDNLLQHVVATSHTGSPGFRVMKDSMKCIRYLA